jgi:hypothetical protein
MKKNQDARCYHLWTQSENYLKEIQLDQRESHIRIFPLVQVGDRHLPRLVYMCHESRAKFVCFIDKLGMMQNVSLVEREC